MSSCCISTLLKHISCCNFNRSVFIFYGQDIMSKFLPTITVVFSTPLSVFLLVMLTTMGSVVHAQEVPAPSVIVQTVQQHDVTPSFQLVGRVEAQSKVDIRARVSGFLIKREFQEGTQVSAGQLLFEIEPDAYQLQVQQSEADLASTRASLSKASTDLKRQKNLHPKQRNWLLRLMSLKHKRN